ncbi:MAG: tyrosine decarboxylase MfnA [Candidatus Syntropharchaeia archaeon]
MNEDGISENAIISFLEEMKEKDLPYERILSSMCTYPHPIAIEAHRRFIEANLGDPGLFPGTKEIENEVIRILGGFLGNPDAVGYIATGGTESNIQAIRAFRNMKGIKKPNVVVPQSAHFSFEKVADILSVEVRKASLDEKFRVDVSSVENLIDDNTIGLVGIAGTTEFGAIDPIEELSKIAVEKDLFLHVDAAFGGFVIPFLDEKYPFDFSVEGVSSISIDPHKMGMSTIPSGGLLFRDEGFLDKLAVQTPYLTSKEQYSLTGTRSGAAAVATYAVLRHLGRKGFREVVHRCLRMTNTLLKKAAEFGIKPVVQPTMNVLTFHVPRLDDVISSFDERRWKVSRTRDPEALRLVIMPHLTEKSLNLFIKDFEEIVCKMKN